MTKEQKIQQITSIVFRDNVDSFTEIEARRKIIDAINDLKSEDEKFEDLNYSLFVQDTKKKNWKRNEHFFKVFYDEIEYIQREFGITEQGLNLIYRIGRCLKWEMNLLVDDKDNPMNQTELCKYLNISERTFRRNSKELIENHILLPVCCGREMYYFMNPHILYVGSKINEQIPNLFELIGYRNYRANGAKQIQKRCEIQ